MRYLLDTNAVSALVRGDGAMLARLASVPRREVGIPQPVLAELEYGIQRLAAGKRRERLAGRLTRIAAELGRAAWDDDVSVRFGAIKSALERRGTRLEDFDLAIAAHALAIGATLVTHDGALVRIEDLEVEDWARPSNA